MTNQKMLVVLVAMLLTTAAGLVWLAMAGNIWAAGILFSVWTLACVVVGAGIVSYVNVARAREEQANFAANAKENLQMMALMQKVQNMQNQSLMQQVGRMPQLMLPSNGTDNFLIEDGIFDELE